MDTMENTMALEYTECETKGEKIKKFFSAYAKRHNITSW